MLSKEASGVVVEVLKRVLDLNWMAEEVEGAEEEAQERVVRNSALEGWELHRKVEAEAEAEVLKEQTRKKNLKEPEGEVAAALEEAQDC